MVSGKVTAPGIENQVTAPVQREQGSVSGDPLGYRVDGDAPLGAVELAPDIQNGIHAAPIVSTVVIIVACARLVPAGPTGGADRRQ